MRTEEVRLHFVDVEVGQIRDPAVWYRASKLHSTAEAALDSKIVCLEEKGVACEIRGEGTAAMGNQVKQSEFPPRHPHLPTLHYVPSLATTCFDQSESEKWRKAQPKETRRSSTRSRRPF